MQKVTFLSLIVVCFFINSKLFAQGLNVVKSKELLKEALEKTVYDIDPSAQAIILYESGLNVFYEFRREFKVEKIIKFLGEDGIGDLGTLNLAQSQEENILNLRITTYNIENGEIVTQTAEKSNILKEQLDKNRKLKKIQFPSIKKGSIVHYTYTLNEPGWVFVPDWYFQGDYPVLYSEFSARVPRWIGYSPTLRTGVLFKTVDKEKELNNCEACSYHSFVSSTDQLLVWVRRNIPAIKNENFVRSIHNYRERVKLNINEIKVNGIWKPIHKDWESSMKTVYIENGELYSQLNAKNAFLQSVLDSIVKGKENNLEKAKSIFNYVKNNFVTDDFSGAKGLKIDKVFENKKGTNFGINLLMLAMLKKAGIETLPVMGTTKFGEKLNPVIPSPFDFNFLIAQISIDKKNYLLDATNKNNIFGFLSESYYNGYCRIVKEKGGHLILEPDQIKNRNVTIATLKNDKNNSKATLIVERQFGVVSAFNLRQKLDNKDSVEMAAYTKEFAGSYSNSTYVKGTFENLTNTELPLKLKLEYGLNIDSTLSTIYFDPYIETFFDKNPFTEQERMYPIEFDYLNDDTYIFKIEIPQKYILDDYPKSTLVKYGEGEDITFRNVMDYSKESNTLTVNCKLNSKRTFFKVSEYESLKEFFSKVVSEQKKKIVLVKETN